ncbi:MAG TPA: hypothetical protein DCM40_02040, partial [Maribacter sp.]|nr:hypothetical protein [Maribacter sp.]
MSDEILLNSFPLRTNGIMFNQATTDPVGWQRDNALKKGPVNAFENQAFFTGEFIAEWGVDLGDIKLAGDLHVDSELAAMKIANSYAVSSPKFRPFLAIVNIPELSGIPTPQLKNVHAPPSREDMEKITSIVLSLKLFRLDNWYGQFAIPSYRDIVKVSYADVATRSKPRFIEPMITGDIRLGKIKNNRRNSPNRNPKSGGYHIQCQNIKKLTTRAQKAEKKVLDLEVKVGGASAASPVSTPIASSTTPALSSPATAPPATGISLSPEEKALNKAKEELKVLKDRLLREKQNLVSPTGKIASTDAEREKLFQDLCNAPENKSLVGLRLPNGSKIVNKTPNNKTLHFPDDKIAQNSGCRFVERKFPPLSIVIHDTAASSGVPYKTYDTFAENERKNDAGEKIGVCSHYIVAENGDVVETLNPGKYYGTH